MTDWTNKSKSISGWSNKSRNSSDWDEGLAFLLQEMGAYLLQENGGRIILQESWNVRDDAIWTNVNRN